MEELHKKDLNELNYCHGVVSHPEPDILEYEIKQVLGSTAVNQASGCNRIPVKLFKTLKDNAQLLHSICQQIWKTQQWPQDWKRSILIPVPKKGSTKECANHWTIALISHDCKVMLKILHARLQHYANQNFQMSKLDLQKKEEPEIKLSTFAGSSKKPEFQKTIYFCFIDYAKPNTQLSIKAPLRKNKTKTKHGSRYLGGCLLFLGC